MADPETYALGASRDYYVERFAGATTGDGEWVREASPVTFARADAPPALVLYAGGESRPLQHQAQLLHRALRSAGAQSELVKVPGEDHYRIVLALSRPDRTAAPAMLEFIRGTHCGSDRLGRETAVAR
jgi:acetyl esterase/lipase